MAKTGTHMGGIRTSEELRLRCVCDREEDGCWHFRSSRGKPMPKERTHRVWLTGVGSRSVTRAMWELHTGRVVPAGYVVLRHCDSYDCIRPDHLRCWPKAKEAAYNAARGRFQTFAKNEANRRNGLMLSKIKPEARIMIACSDEPAAKLAAELGICQSWVYTLRRRGKLLQAKSSVFAAGGAA